MRSSSEQTRPSHQSPSDCNTIGLLPPGGRLSPLRILQRACLLSLLLAAPAAMAHHPMGGEVPGTLWQGLLSGLAHPVIAVDHLAFMLALAMLVTLSVPHQRHAVVPLVAFVALASAGVVLQAGAPMLPGLEWLVGGALCAVALVLWAWRKTAAVVRVWGAAAAGGAGLVHGLAYGEAVIGAEPTPVVAYLVGLALVQLAVMTGTAWAVRKLVVRQSRHLAAVSRVVAGTAALAGFWVLGTAAVG